MIRKTLFANATRISILDPGRWRSLAQYRLRRVARMCSLANKDSSGFSESQH